VCVCVCVILQRAGRVHPAPPPASTAFFASAAKHAPPRAAAAVAAGMADLRADDTGNAIVPVLACVLNQLCLRNDRLPMSQKGLSKFHALRPPAISIKDYLQRVAKYAACSGECFVLALVYIDRIIQSNPTFVVNSLNIHRLLITSIMLAAKFFDDQYFNNSYYSKVGGVPCNEINSLEVEFLFMCNFTLFVTTDTYSQYYTELCNHAVNTTNLCACSQGPKVPPLVIPYVNAPGPGQTITEWNRQQSSQIPRSDDTGDMVGADGQLSEEEMAHYVAQQQQQQQQAYEQQLQQQQQHEAAAAAAAQQQYANYTPAQLQQLAAQQQAQKQRYAQQQQQQYAQQQQHDQPMS